LDLPAKFARTPLPEESELRGLARGLGNLAMGGMVLLISVLVGVVAGAVGFVTGLLIFGAFGLEGWPLAIPTLIVTFIAFVLGALTTWDPFDPGEGYVNVRDVDKDKE